MKTPFVRTNRRILIIDDTPSIHEDFRKILGPEPEGEHTLASTEEALFGTLQLDRLTFQLDSAYQGQDALELVRGALSEGQPYAMAFIDMRMPPAGTAWKPSSICGTPTRTCKSRCAPPIPITAGKTWPNAWSSATSCWC
jgi:CheY-like chemotaxis protein